MPTQINGGENRDRDYISYHFGDSSICNNFSDLDPMLNTSWFCHAIHFVVLLAYCKCMFLASHQIFKHHFLHIYYYTRAFDSSSSCFLLTQVFPSSVKKLQNSIYIN
jgi:hypothetical protein